jgi:competence ComEA-like helix-hairpin-helix protein
LEIVKALRTIGKRILRGLEQFYSPKELRAIGLFLLAGLGVLTYRLFNEPVERDIKLFQDAKYLTEAAERDSMFQVLAQRRARADSFYFYFPDTSDNEPRPREIKQAKTAGLAQASISLNASGREQLMKLPSVGPATADLILEYRSERGRFRTLTEIMNVRGIGPKKFERMKPFLKLD